ncbi:MAG: ABC transporter substrate binding protein, partial [Cyanobacteriota bacterium]
MKPRIIFLALLVNVVFMLLPLYAKDLKEVNIGILFDGPSFINERIFNTVSKEIKDLIGDEYTIVFPDDKILVGDWSNESIKDNIELLLEDNDIDIIIALGFMSSSDLVLREKINKPVIAPMLSEEMLNIIPYKEGTSGKKNLNYIIYHSGYKKDLRMFKKLTSFNNLVILANKNYAENLKLLKKDYLKEAEKSLNADITQIFIGDDIDDAIRQMPADCDAVYLFPLMNLSKDKLAELINKLNDRKLPTFSYIGQPEIELGVLATLSPDYDFIRMSRFMAINLQDIILGAEPSELPVIFKPSEKLIINAETATKIGYQTTWDILTEATMYNADKIETDRLLSLSKVIEESLAVNLDVIAKQYEVKASKKDIAKARSRLLPQISYSGQWTALDKKRARATPGNTNRHSLNQSVDVSQIIFSEEAFANVSIQKNIYRSDQADLKTLELDIASDAATAYMDVLKTKTLLRIELDNLEVSRSNLELARTRQNIGSSTAAEV